jgi:hypothetical protein
VGDQIEVDDGGLHVLAGLCDTVTAALTTTVVAPAAGPAEQATAAAVAGGHTLVETVAAALTAHAADTGAKVRSAAGVYSGTDHGSAENLSAVGRSVEV